MIVIAGAGGGIGSALFDMYEYDREDQKACVHKPHGKYRLPIVDITKEEEVVKWARDVYEVPGLDPTIEVNDTKVTLVNCVGYNHNEILHHSNSDEWRKTIEVNVIGAYNLLKAFLPHMRWANFGRVILLSSVVAQKGVAGTSAYAASKAALWGLTKAAAEENKDYDVTINCINLGYTNTGMIRDVPEKNRISIMNKMVGGKLCTARDVYNTIEYLRKTDSITGAMVDLNGGLL